MRRAGAPGHRDAWRANASSSSAWEKPRASQAWRYATPERRASSSPTGHPRMPPNSLGSWMRRSRHWTTSRRCWLRRIWPLPPPLLRTSSCRPRSSRRPQPGGTGSRSPSWTWLCRATWTLLLRQRRACTSTRWTMSSRWPRPIGSSARPRRVMWRPSSRRRPRSSGSGGGLAVSHLPSQRYATKPNRYAQPKLPGPSNAWTDSRRKTPGVSSR